jgi:hypothetical protein
MITAPNAPTNAYRIIIAIIIAGIEATERKRQLTFWLQKCEDDRGFTANQTTRYSDPTGKVGADAAFDDATVDIPK